MKCCITKFLEYSWWIQSSVVPAMSRVITKVMSTNKGRVNWFSLEQNFQSIENCKKKKVEDKTRNPV